VTAVPTHDEPVVLAAKWIDELRDAHPAAWRSRPRAVCAALCAARVASRPVEVDWASELLTDTSDAALRDLLAAPLAQTLMAAILCEARIPLLDRVLGSALELFASDPAPTVATTEGRLVAHAAGLAAAPGLPPWPGIRLPLGDPEVAAFAAGASAATGFGTAQRPGGGDLADLAAGLAAHHLRAYDLGLGSALLRTVAHLGAAGSIAAQRCVEFVRLQQRAEGSFGYFGPEDLDLAARLPDCEPSLDLHLPVTVSCMLALAEAGDPACRFVQMV
jgi:hypothetical protein